MRSVKEGGESVANMERQFAKLMIDGKVRAAHRLFSMKAQSVSLTMDEIIEDGFGRTVREISEEKHPNASPAKTEAIWNDEPVINFILSFLTASLQKSFKPLPCILKVMQVLLV